jgi:hypothetical protein
MQVSPGVVTGQFSLVGKSEVMKKPGSSGLFVPKCAASLALLVLIACLCFGKRRDDVVTMNNGDKFTREAKTLRYGELVVKSEHMKDSVHLDRRQVEALQS